MAKNEIGKTPCPCCNEPASVREQKNGRTYILCNSPVCGFQGFTRSAEADRALRGKVTPVDGASPVPAPAPVSQPPKKKGIFDDLAF